MEFLYQHEDIIGEISRWIFISSHFDIKGEKLWNYEKIIHNFGATIQKLSCVNNIYYKMFSNETLGKKVVDMFSHKRLCHSEILRHLNPTGGIFYQIKTKIENLFDIAFNTNKYFSDEDLKDNWYFNTTVLMNKSEMKMRMLPYKNSEENKKIRCGTMDKVNILVRPSLFGIVIKTGNLDKIKQLISTQNTIDNFLLVNIARSRIKAKNKKHKINYFTVALLLLEHGVNRITKCDNDYPTALMIAVYHDDEEYTYILLKYNIDIYEKCCACDQQLESPYCIQSEKIRDVFEIGKDKEWFIEMLNHFNIKRS
jgi:hypothetical protein